MKQGSVGMSRVAACALLCWVAVAPALAQQKGAPPPVVRVSEEQAINTMISEMLAAWQIGDLAILHNYHADDVVVVSGVWEPPVAGWAAYAQSYQRQRERMEKVRFDRRNTYVNVKGNFAWAAYQWEFAAVVDGKVTAARGHTTLILEKRREKWLIVHNHTSLVAEAQAPEAAPPAPQKP